MNSWILVMMMRQLEQLNRTKLGFRKGKCDFFCLSFVLWIFFNSCSSVINCMGMNGIWKILWIFIILFHNATDDGRTKCLRRGIFCFHYNYLFTKCDCFEHWIFLQHWENCTKVLLIFCTKGSVRKHNRLFCFVNSHSIHKKNSEIVKSTVSFQPAELKFLSRDERGKFNFKVFHFPLLWCFLLFALPQL